MFTNLQDQRNQAFDRTTVENLRPETAKIGIFILKLSEVTV